MIIENINSSLSNIKTTTVIPRLSFLNNTITLSQQAFYYEKNPNMITIRVCTSVANFTKNIGIYNIKIKNCLFEILHKTNKMIDKLYKFDITHIEFICNEFGVSLAILVSLMVKFKDITFNKDLNLLENEHITKQYIRKIISYVYQFTGSFQISRDFCKQLNKFYIDKPLY
jgi:hypothetical protein